MDHSKIWLGIVYVLIGQIGTFIQLQASYKFGWYDKYPLLVILASLPLGWVYIKSVHLLIQGFNNQIWPSRLMGFGVGVIVFTTMSMIIFNEHLSLKNGVCLGLGLLIILIQVFVK